MPDWTAAQWISRVAIAGLVWLLVAFPVGVIVGRRLRDDVNRQIDGY